MIPPSGGRVERGNPLSRKTKYDEKLLFILDQACGIFAEKGYHNSSVRDVAAATGVSPAGLYYYFQSKEELLHLILKECLSSLLQGIRGAIVDIEDPALRLRTVIRTHLEYVRRNGKEMRVLVHEWEALTGTFGAEVRQQMREYAQLAVGLFKELFPRKTYQELRATAFGMFGMLSWVDQWHRPEKDLPLDQLADQFSSILLGGSPLGSVDRMRRAEEDDEDPAENWSKPSSAGSILSGPGF